MAVEGMWPGGAAPGALPLCLGPGREFLQWNLPFPHRRHFPQQCLGDLQENYQKESQQLFSEFFFYRSLV